MKRIAMFILLFSWITTGLAQQNWVNSTALKSGCRILASPASAYTNDIHIARVYPWTAQGLLDGTETVGWRSAQGAPLPLTFLFELSENFILEKFIFNNKCYRSSPGICAKEVKVEVSIEGPHKGFRETSIYILKEYASSEFSIHSLEARWIRLTILRNYGNKEFTELMEFTALGRYADQEYNAATIVGVWDTNFDHLSLKSNDSGYVYGCYKKEHGELYAEKVDRREFHFQYSQKADGKKGWARLVINKEGDRLSGIWGENDNYSKFGFWDFSKKSDQPYSCEKDSEVEETKPAYQLQSSESLPEVKSDSLSAPSFLSLKVRLLDLDNGTVLNGMVHVSRNSSLLTEGKTSEGVFFSEVPPGINIKVKGEAQGYMSVTESVDSLTRDKSELVLKLKKLEAGKSMVIEHIWFERGKYELAEESFAELDKIVQMMTDYPKMEIEIAGHTDNQGDPKKNVELSESRVKEVKDYIVSKGIKASRISGVGYGGAKPIAGNDKEETRKLNRRVEFKIIKM